MKVLGRGWQYTTYDLGNGRVLKRYNSAFVACILIFLNSLYWWKPAPWKLLAYHRDCKSKAHDSMIFVQRNVLESWMIGNPKVLNDLDYEQDKLTPLHKVIRGISTEKGKELIDAFVAFNAELLRRGVIDKSFNITKNFGLDAKDRVVLMDLGELFTAQEAIQKQIRERKWATPYVAQVMRNRELRDYYVAQMDRHFRLN